VGRLQQPTLLFHYTTAAAIQKIAVSRELFSALLATCQDSGDTSFGDGLYVTQRSPEDCGSKQRVLINNYTNADNLQEQLAGIQAYEGRADFCIPVFVARSSAKDVHNEATEAMVYGKGRMRQDGKALRKDRDVWVIALYNKGCVTDVRDVGQQIQNNRSTLNRVMLGVGAVGELQSVLDNVRAGTFDMCAAIVDDWDESCELEQNYCSVDDLDTIIEIMRTCLNAPVNDTVTYIYCTAWVERVRSKARRGIEKAEHAKIRIRGTDKAEHAILRKVISTFSPILQPLLHASSPSTTTPGRGGGGGLMGSARTWLACDSLN
jgi:hypothetical protein